MRAIDRLGLDLDRGRGGRVRLTNDDLQCLEAELGATPRVGYLTRVQTRMLAALARAPRGLASVRAVARRSGVSPTAASRALATLERRGLVRRDQEQVAAGRARTIQLIRAVVTDPTWPRLAPGLARVRIPMTRAGDHPTSVPTRLAHLFWNADRDVLTVGRHGAYIANRLLTTGDLDGLAWGRRALSARDWQRAATDRGLSDRQRALAHNLARAASDGDFDRTRVQFLKAGLNRPEHRLEPTIPVAGMETAGLGDLLAMKLNAIAGRAQLRDYFDLLAIEQIGGRTVEEGIALYLGRYRPDHPDSAIRPILLGLGYLEDVADDPFLPTARASIARYWQQRQPVFIANLEREGIVG
jgi:hypothetical protein